MLRDDDDIFGAKDSLTALIEHKTPSSLLNIASAHDNRPLFKINADFSAKLDGIPPLVDLDANLGVLPLLSRPPTKLYE